MAELKTIKTEASVAKFLDSIADETKRRDSYTLLDMFKKATRSDPKMWGSAIIGFGDFHYVYATGREGDWFVAGFSPRKQNLTLYAMCRGWETLPSIQGLGKYSLGKGCLYIKRLDDVNLTRLRKLIGEAVADSKEMARDHTKKKEHGKPKKSK